MPVEQRMRQFAQVAAVAVVIVGCYLVLRPFISAILFAVVACSSSWPLYARLRAALQGRSTPAALAMVLLMIVLVIGPSTLLALSLTDNVTTFAETAQSWLNRAMIQPPAWLKDLPLVGAQLNSYWLGLISGREEAAPLLDGLLQAGKNILLAAGIIIGQSLLQMTFAIFIAFFFFRDGEIWVETLRIGLDKLAGDVGAELLTTIQGTVASVIYGIFGTALAQALTAWIGFLIAGVPGASMLGVATFFLSVVPIGPPLVWIGAALWLFGQGDIGWAVFMALWGIFAISAIDNLVKPYLISRGSGLSLLLIVLGAAGGVAAFGFIGIFIGPPLLAVGLILIRLWTAPPPSGHAPP